MFFKRAEVRFEEICLISPRATTTYAVVTIRKMIQYTDNVVCAKSPWFPVIWITYEPGRTFPIMKPPWATPVPSWITQAALPSRTTLGDEGLEIVQVWSVGRRPAALTETHLPASTLGRERMRTMAARILSPFGNADQLILIWSVLILIVTYQKITEL